MSGNDGDFGDIDPEDAWDDGDPFEDKLDVVERIVDDLTARRDDRHEFRRSDALRLLGKLERDRTGDPRLAELRQALEAL